MIGKELTLEDYFGRCRNTKVIRNKRGSLVPVSCNNCPDCHSRKASRYVQLCNQESLENSKTFFITLTYNYLNLPIMKLVPSTSGDHPYKTTTDGTLIKPTSDHFIKCIDITRRKVHPKDPDCNTYRKTSTYGKEIHRLNTTFKDPLFAKFYKKSRFTSRIFRQRKFKFLPYLCKEDLQKFIKRLRFHIAKDFNTEIRFFAVGEYTPIHFLPHFHIQLFVNEPRLYPVIEEYVNKCWQYGIADTQPAKSNNGVASYLSSYTNSFTKLPRFLNGSQIKPFSLHSRYLGTRTNLKVAKFIYSYDRVPFDEITYLVDGRLRSFALSSQSANYFFPRCYDYNGKTTEDKQRLYTIYQYLKREYKSESPVDLTKHLLLNPYKKNSLSIFKLLDLVPLKDFNPSVFLDVLETTDKLVDELSITIFNRIYSAILLSKHFYTLTQTEYFDNLSQYKRNLLLYDKIDSFHSQKELNSLATQLFMENEWYRNFEMTDYDLFYPIGTKNYDEIFRSSNFIKYISFNNDLKYEERVKHKKLNDANEIFVKSNE